MSLLAHLNPEQREAAAHIDGPLLILAGAGSGKTRVIVHRIAYLLEQGFDPSSILAVSFTNRAVREMEERVAHMINNPKQVKKLTLSTFHSLGVKILRRDLARLGYPKKFAIYDAGDQLALIRRSMKQAKVSEKEVDPQSLLLLISQAKNKFEEPEDQRDPMFAEVYAGYERSMRSCGAVDFDDLIRLPVKMLREEKAVHKYWAGRFKQIMIDEYQDTNRAQLLMVQELASIHKNLCVVGDDDQSIYGWRGSDVENIRQFSRQYSDTKVVMLTQNYRCSANILEAANKVIEKGKGRYAKKLWTQSESGSKLQLAVQETEDQEAHFVVDHLYKLKHEFDLSWKDISIMYRTNAQSRAFEEQLRNDRIPYKLVGGQTFFERKEIRDLIAYLRIINTPSDEIAVRRIINYPTRGIGDTTIDRLAKYATLHQITFYEACTQVESNQEIGSLQQRAVMGFVELMSDFRRQHNEGTLSLQELINSMISQLRLKNAMYKEYDDLNEAKRRIDNMSSLVNAVSQYEERFPNPSLDDYLERVMLDQRLDDKKDKEQDDDAVTMITLHGAKGLEFPVVYLVGFEEGFMPYYRPREACNVEEERRLCYVGITRAKKRLIITRAKERKRFGRKMEREPSRFLSDIPRSLVEYIDGSTPVAAKKTPEEREARFKDFFSKIREITDES